jgi:hypothetical protein
MSDLETIDKDTSTTIPEVQLEKRKHHKKHHQKSTRDSLKSAKKTSTRTTTTQPHSSTTKRSLSSCYKRATLTQYWIPKQGDKDMLNNGQIVTLTGSENQSLKTTSGSLIAKVSKTTYEVHRL